MFFPSKIHPSGNRARLCLAALSLAVLIQPVRSATYTVNNATDFNNLPRLNAGDVVKMNSGTYGVINKTLESSISDDTTAKNNPILIYAVTPGGVVVNAPSQITLSGRGITLAGLDFNANSGILAGSAYLVGTASGSRYMTLSHLRFNGCGAGATDGKWIYIQGFYAAIEYCTLTERPDTIRNATVAFLPNTAEGGVTVPRLHKVRYCYFGPRYAVVQNTSSDLDNGFESLRIGVGDVQTFDMQVTVERNVFYRSIWRADGQTAGEPEIISIKSKGNKILNNTILESQGGICFRSGAGSTVEGNFIFGGGYYTNGTNIALGTPSENQAGIRVIGPDQIVRNNYIANVVGDGIRASLSVMSGESDYNPGNPANNIGNTGSYQPAHNAKIYNNTFINCKEMSLGLLSNDSLTNSSGAYVAKSPTNVQMFNNVWQGNGTATAAINRETAVVSNYTSIVLGGSGANYIYETSSSKYGWNGLTNSTYTASASPLINSNFDNYKIPASGSPLLNKGTNTLAATTDIRALARPTNNTDIGCFEVEVAGSGLKPLLKSEVGVVFDGGPSSYPVAGSGDSKPTILTAAIVSASVGTSYYQLMQASGGDGLLVWSISSGSLPPGLALSGGGILSGTPTTIGTYTFTARVTDSDAVGPDYAEKAYSLVVASSGGAKLTISSVKAYSTSSGSKTSYSYDGATNTRWSTTVTSKNPNTNGTNFGKDCAWIWWDLGENKNLTSLKLNWYNGSTRTYTYRIDSGTNTNSWTTILPRTNSATNGLTNGYQTVNLDSASGRYVRLVCWGNSTSNGYIHVTESEIYGSTTATQDPRRRQSIVFGALDPALETDPPVALSAYSLSESNASTDLPVGYDSSDPNVAVIDGSTVTITGSGSTWITASQSGDTNYQAATPVQQILTVTAVVPDITSATTVTAQRGLPFRYQITASRDATSFGASGLPTGLTVNSVSGRISGTPTEAGSFAVTLSAQNAAGTGTAILNLNVVSPYVYETFESYTNGIAVPLVAPSSVTSGIKASGQVTNSAGNSIIGGVGGKVAWFNDTSTVTGGSGQLEFNAGASGQSYLAASFELLHNAVPSASGAMPLIVSLAAWNTANDTVGGSASKRIAALEFNQFGSLTTPAWSVKGATTNGFTYILTNKQAVHLFANDHDANTINFVGPDGNVRTLNTNSFAVFLNSGFIGMYGLNLAATDNAAVPAILTGNNNLGRLCFNTSTGNTGSWLIDNVLVSDLPVDVAIPAPAPPIITSPSAASGQAGYAFAYDTTASELPDSYVCEGSLPTGLSFNPATGLISGTPNQSGVFPVTIYASNSAGTGLLELTITIAPAPPNIFSGSNPSLNTAASWSLGTTPTASSNGGSYTDLVFSSSATNLTTSSGNINGKSWNVTNGLNYTLSSVRTNIGAETTYKMGNTGATDTSPFTNTVTGATNELIYLANNSSLTFSPASPSNSIPAIAQLRNSGNMRIETGSTLHIPCSIGQSTNGTSFTKTGGGKLSLSGSNTYSGTTTINEGTLALGGSSASAVTIKSNSILETSLTGSSAPSAVLSGTLTLEPGAKVRVVGTPAAGSTNTLVASAALSGTPVLLDTIAGFQLSNNATSLFLVPSAADTVKPVIFLDGTASVSVDWGSSYLDAGATATDDRDSVVTVTTSGSVDTSVLGNYLLTYRARDAAGNDANPVNRTVSVQMIDPASSGSDGVPQLLKYALGGTSAGSTVTLPIVSSATDFLILTATVRTNDPALAITGQAATDLSGSGNWTNSGVSVFPSSDQQAVPPGCERRDFSVEKGVEQKKFLRLLIIR